MQFTRATINIKTLAEVRQVEGYQVTCQELGNATVGVHKSENGSGWQVTEMQTGMRVCTDKTRKAAVEQALKLIEAKGGIEEFNRIVESALKSQEKNNQEKERQAKIDAENQEREDRAAGRAAARELLYDGTERILSVTEIEEVLENLENADNYSDQYKRAFTRVFERELNRIKESQESVKDEPVMLDEPKKEKIDVKSIFKGLTDMLSIKKLFRKYAKMVHPDQSGDDGSTFKELQSEYEKALKMADGKAVNTEGKEIQLSKDMQEIINKLSEIPNLEIKIRGSWLWVGGDTKPVKDKLLEIGLKWGVKAQEWYFADEVKGQSKRRGRGYSKEQLRDKYGEVIIDKTKGKRPIESQVSESKSKYTKGRK